MKYQNTKFKDLKVYHGIKFDDNRGYFREVFKEKFVPPTTDGSGNIRAQLRIASKLLKDSGWEIKDGKRINESGEKLKFEILYILFLCFCSSKYIQYINAFF